MTWKNCGFLLDVSVKLFYTDDVCPLNSNNNNNNNNSALNGQNGTTPLGEAKVLLMVVKNFRHSGETHM
jgi:hypothetical protein